jgi:imidazolonepropionase-like amidohydrolase
VLTLLFATSILPPAIWAQSQLNQPEAYAITNARLVTLAGAQIERGTIVVRDGLISAVGANIQAPADVRVIDGTGLTVYPGFFDANTSLGIAGAQPRQVGGALVAALQPQPNQQSASNSNFPAGLQPETAAADLLRVGDSSFETARNNGFTSVLSVPRERLFVGQSALINTAGDSTAALILRSPAAMHVTFVPLQNGQFPTSIMGAFAAVRQMLLDAERLQTSQKVYAANPRGVRRPDADKSLVALLPVLSGAMPIVFTANSEREITRALDLAREFNLKAMIAGGNEAYKVAARLKEQNVPVLVSLNFPKRTATASSETDPESLVILRLRVETPKNAARLGAAGVKFAFQSGGAVNLADFWTNLNKAVENGLSRDAALRAMTLGTAEIFGVSNTLGSLETGKIANLTVTRGEIFDKSHVFTHVFVDGRMFEIKPTPTPKADDKKAPANSGVTPSATTSALPNVSGTWALNIEIPGQPVQATLVLAQQEDKLSGSLQSQFGNSEITGGEISADGFRFSNTVSVGGQTFDVLFNGKINGNQLSGTATTPQGTFPITGTKNP